MAWVSLQQYQDGYSYPAYHLIRSEKLQMSDRVSIVQFDDQASTIIELTPATQVVQLEDAIANLCIYFLV